MMQVKWRLLPTAMAATMITTVTPLERKFCHYTDLPNNRTTIIIDISSALSVERKPVDLDDETKDSAGVIQPYSVRDDSPLPLSSFFLSSDV
jgi:hypothetical protein